ncbi:S8 family serine peptidase [Persicobacter diffluens]|uniref:Fibronectin type-III domain-containing protein n=1 Tax=Persicobacter diffluens TaxID=981 RepID=A0AAN4W239_9BACT|nr:hypothetical protein PEDI_44900 [Persicobacter diffluens]
MTHSLTKKVGRSLLLTCLIYGWIWQWAAAQTTDYEANRLRVKFTEAAVQQMENAPMSFSTDGTVLTSMPQVNHLNQQFLVTDMKRVFPHAGKHEDRHRKHGLHLWYEMDAGTAVNLQAVSIAYQELGDIQLAEPVYKKVLLDEGKPVYLEAMKSAMADSTNLPTNDTYLPYQWHYENDGSRQGALAGADINLFKAWEVETGKSEVIISIVDGGIDTQHEDLLANLWVNELELNGTPGVDDDNNGYIDDIYGYNFVMRTGEVSAHDHGTHVAGTVGAVNNNGIGVAGVAGGSGQGDGIRLMSGQVFSKEGSASNFAAAIVYGADNGAVISQNSWGYSSPNYFDQSVLDAIDYFIEEAGMYPGSPMQGGIVIFAAGNSNSDAIRYPGAYEPVLSVGSTNPANERAWYSNFGPWVDVMAPGGETDFMEENWGGVVSTMPNNTYGYMQGTSMACPHVSGIAGLVVSAYGGQGFTNEDLKKRLLSACTSIDEYNPDFIGATGLGLMDAYEAVRKDGGLAPVKMVDFSLAEIGQNQARLNWTVPADEDDEKPAAYTLYYSLEAFSETSKQTARQLEIKNEWAAGELVNKTISGLMADTLYYFAGEATDRWGNTSPLSAVISGRTTEGAKIVLNPSSLDIEVNTEATDTESSTLSIINEEAGNLNWEISARATSHYYSSSAFPNIPEAGTSTFDYGKVTIMEKAADNAPERLLEISKALPHATENGTIDYGDGRYAGFFIGESDVDLPHSMATKYMITQPEGFNITNFQVYLTIDPEFGPVEIEFYQGAQMSRDNLIYTHTHKVYQKSSGYQRISLNEQLFIPYGETVWVAVHVPGGNERPLGVIRSQNEKFADYTLLSFDEGKKWVKLGDLFGSNAYVWDMWIEQKSPHFTTYLQFDPATGTTASKDTTEIEFTANAAELINGTYRSNIVVHSNDDQSLNTRIPLKVTVKGQQPEMYTEESYDLPNVFVGETGTIRIPVENHGLGNFLIQDIISSHPAITVTDRPRSRISARSVEEIELTFAPETVGNVNATINLQDKNGSMHAFSVFGVGVAPAEISINNIENDLGQISLGEPLSSEVMLTNVGEYPLRYAFPKFVDNPEDWVNSAEFLHRAGYSYSIIQDPEAYEFEDISTTGEDVTDYLQGTGYRGIFHQVDIGFGFPYFNEFYEKIYISNHGLLSLDDNSSFNKTPMDFLDTYNPSGTITALGWRYDLGIGGKVYMKRTAGKLAVQYSDVIRFGDTTNGKTTFQIILHDNGNIDFVYQDFTNYSSYNSGRVFVAIENFDKTDGLLIQDFNNKTTLFGKDPFKIAIKSPGVGLVNHVSTAHGILQPGESVNVEVGITSEGVAEGLSYDESLTLLTNDPQNTINFLHFKFDVGGGGAYGYEVSHEALDYGTLFRKASRREIVALKNTGNKLIHVNAATFEGDRFHLTRPFEAVQIAPRQITYFEIEADTESLTDGLAQDALTISLGQGEDIVLPLQVEVVEGPAIAVNPGSFTKTLTAQAQSTEELTIENNGGEPLEMSIHGPLWAEVSEKAAMANIPDFTYSYRIGDEEGGPQFKWEDMSGAESTDLGFIDFEYWHSIAMPFPFEFYGEPQDSLHFHVGGVLTFDHQNKHQTPFLTNKVLGTVKEEENVDNLIAGLWAVYQPDYFLPRHKSGLFLKTFEDRMVAEYRNFNGPGSPDHSLQIILYKNGNIKMQYRFDDFYHLTKAGIVGLENKGSTLSTQVYYNSTALHDKSVIEYIPTWKYEIPAGGSKTFLVDFNASSLKSSTVESSIVINNNTADQPYFTVPLNLTVEGMADLAFNKDDLEMGEILAYESSFGLAKAYEELITITNSGEADVEISGITLQNGMSELVMEYYKLVDPWWGTWDWVSVDQMEYPLKLEPGENFEFRLTITPEVRDYLMEDAILISGTVEKSIPFSAHAVMKPNAAVDFEDLHLMAKTKAETFSYAFNISNAEGMSALNYDIEINYEREAVSTDALRMNVSEGMPAAMAAEKVEELQVLSAAHMRENTYNRTMEIVEGASWEDNFGYGPGYIFTSATRFNAGQEGFKLSHFRTWMNMKGLTSASINYEIRVGTEALFGTTVVAKGSYQYENEDMPENGQLVDIPLEEPLALYPNEVFYIIIEYPFGMWFPQGTFVTESPITNTFFMGYNGTYNDFTEYNGSKGFMVMALEEAYEDNAWLKILTPASGQVVADDALEVALELYAANAQYVNNNARITVRTNDPENMTHRMNLQMAINQAAKLQLRKDQFLKVHEMDTLMLYFDLFDEEDSVTVQLKEDYQYAEVAISEEDETEVVLSFTPDYDGAGVHALEIYAEDKHGVGSAYMLEIEALNVNRAPVALGNEYTLETRMKQLNTLPVSELFEDPDGDEMTFSVSPSPEMNELATIMLSANLQQMHIEVKKPGNAEIMITARDSHGDETAQSFTLNFDVLTGINSGLETIFKAYPNPVSQKVRFEFLSEQSQMAALKIYNPNGQIIYQLSETAISTGKQDIDVDLSHQSPGIYIYQILLKDGNRYQGKLIKE